MSANVIGAADEFWRLRLTRVDTSDEVDFEWHDDILYREPKTQETEEVELWHIEAVSTDGLETVVRVRTFDDRRAAQRFFDSAADDLSEMTKSQFETAYLTSANPDSDAGPDIDADRDSDFDADTDD